MKQPIVLAVAGALSWMVTPTGADAPAAAAAAVTALKPTLPPLPPEPSPQPSPRLATAADKALPPLLLGSFEGNAGRRLVVQTDKPLYRPGETIWFKAWDLQARTLTGSDSALTTVMLISPKGATVLTARLRHGGGGVGNAFELPAEAAGGEYTLRALSGDGHQAERSVVVSVYEPPRLKKKLEFTKKAYGAGDAVSASVEVRRPTGQALAAKALTAVITLDGVELPRLALTSNADGGALLTFELPSVIAAGDGLLTVLVEDGGVTESISKAIPIVQKKLALGFFPEGGTMVAGLPTRLYFEAKNLHGKPADVQGRVIDDLGNAVIAFASAKNGLGRVEFTPARGRTYHAEITRPSDIAEKVALPRAEAQGCVLRGFDDFDSEQPALRVAVRCSERRKVVVAATLREQLIDIGSVQADAAAPGVIHLASADAALQRAAGVARITVFDEQMNPLAERLTFRNRRERLRVTAELDKKSYTPRDEVALTLTTRDSRGQPVAAELALSVVDDTVLSHADDKSGHLLSKLLLEPELPGKVEEPNFYLDLSEAQSAQALDLLMGTRGYRRFEWLQVARPVPAAAVAAARGGVVDAADLRLWFVPPMAMLLLPPRPLLAAPAAPVRLREAKQEQAGFIERDREQAAGNDALRGDRVAVDKDFARAAGKRAALAAAPPAEPEWTPVRVFPVPALRPGYTGPRDDARETVFWAPAVKTDARGKASVKFTLSDAVTSFRISSEGVGAGLAGRDETVFKSTLPFSLAVKLPLEVSAGDQPLIPVTLANDSERALDVRLDASFGALMRAAATPGSGDLLPAGQRKSLFVPLDVTGTRGTSNVRVSARAGGLADDVLRGIPVVPLGFPQTFETSGQLGATSASHDVDLSRARAGSVQATVTVYPSLVATTLAGLAGMLREPGGCFEQTSSTNYPNVMVMRYLKQHGVADAALVERSSKLLDSGYKKLVGFESPKKGFEWFGGDPGHEALTAYGLLQFADMKDVHGGVDGAMLARTGAWLKSRRDGRGGYLRDAKALDSFGRASADVTDAYITWALVSAGQRDGLDAEIAKSAKLAETTTDAYQLALAAGTLLQRPAGAAPSPAALAAAAKLATMQDAAGAWTQADHSITKSGGANLHVETTALAVLALLQADAHLDSARDGARKGVAWLQEHRGGFGQWGATQSTVLALKALTRFDETARVAPQAGVVTLSIDGVAVAEQAFEAGRREPLVFTGFDAKLAPGKHRIMLAAKTAVGNASAAESAPPLPYSVAVEYRTSEPVSSQAAAVQLAATLARSELKMGETVRLNATIANATQRGQPMTLARLGLPGGLTFQPWQLKDLREKGEIAFYETRAREVILYFRDLKPGEVKKIGIDLVAAVPGRYTGPASSAYLYYDDTAKHWAAPLAVRIAP